MLAIRISKGFSLLECLVAMGLFAWILIICEGMFVIQKKAIVTVSDDIKRLDRVRQLYLRLDPLIRSAGFLGMQSFSSGLPITVQGDIPYSQMPRQALTLHRAYGKTWDPPLPGALTSQVVAGTDVLIMESVNTLALPKVGWFVLADGMTANIFYSDTVPTKTLSHEVIGAWQITAIYVQKGQTGLELMQKSLLPMSDAMNILTELESFECELDGGLLKVTTMFEGETIHVWFGQDNAHLFAPL